MDWTRDEIISMLKNNVCTIDFMRRDGTPRTMRATLLENYLPAQSMQDLDAAKIPNPEIVTCWDVEKQAWRSIRINSLKDIEI